MGKNTNYFFHRGRRTGLSATELGKIRKMSEEAANKMETQATEKAILYMLAIPISVLCTDYWEKSAKKRIPEFAKKVWSLYKSVEMGCVTDEDLAQMLDDFAGMKFEADWLKKKEET